MALRSQSGSVSVFIVAIVPLFVILFGLIVNIGSILVARQRLQVVLDRAVYAGAASLSFDLNRIAGLNWEIAHKFAEVRDDFAASAEAPRTGDQRLRDAHAYQAVREGEMHTIADTMQERARAQAAAVFAAQLPQGSLAFPTADAGDVVECDGDPQSGERLRGYLGYDEIQGAITFDPVEARGNAGGDELLRHCVKDAGLIALGGFAQVHVEPLILSDAFPDVRVTALSAAQPFGGSIEMFSTVEAESLEQAQATDEWLYRAGTIPVSSVSDLIEDDEMEEEWSGSVY